jgi:DNA-binding transcriptional ArsR family regulator
LINLFIFDNHYICNHEFMGALMSNGNAVTARRQQLAMVLRVMAHADRLAILEALLDGPMIMGDIARRLALRGASTSQHLALLRLNRLIAARRQGRNIHYVLVDRDMVAGILSMDRQNGAVANLPFMRPTATS